MGTTWRARSLLWYVVALVAAVSIPLLILSAALSAAWVHSERDRLEAGSFEAVDNAQSQIDRYIAGRIAMLQALATSPAFDAKDYERIDAQARELLDLQGSNIVLRELDGRQLVNTRLPWGAPLPRGKLITADDEVARTQRPYVADLYIGTASGGPLVRIVVPVIRNGTVVASLTASLPPLALVELLRSAGIGPPYSATVVDRQGVILASTQEMESVGQPLSGFSDRSGDRGRWSGYDLQGQPLEGAYRKSLLSGWLVEIGVQKASLDAPLYRTLLVLGLGAAALCLVAFFASWLIGRRLVSSQKEVARTAQSLRLGEVAVAPQTAVLEADEVGKALVDASARLRQQANEIAWANEELETRVEDRTKELIAQAEILTVTLDNMDQGLIMIAADGTIPVANKRAVEILELPQELMANSPTFDAIVQHQLEKDDFSKTGDEVRRLVRGGGLEGVALHYERERPNGSVLEVRTVPLPSGGEIRTYSDISARRKAEEAVRDSEARLRLIAENASDMIVRSDLDSTRRYVSPGCRALLGFEPQELVGTKPLDGVHPHDIAAYGLILNELKQGLADQAVSQQRYRRRDGSWVWTEATFKLTRDDEGSPDGYVASVRDISIRKAAEEALRNSEQRLAYALDSGSDGLWDRDIANDQTWYSDRWCTMLGYAPGEMDGPRSKLIDLIHPDDRKLTERLMGDHLSDQTPVYECEHRLRTKAGRYTWVLARGKVVDRDSTGRPLRMVGTQIDIDARKQAEGRIAYMARHDALTDLPNRAVFYECLDQRLKEVRRHKQSCAVLCLDLDSFKAVNDSLGHAAGDALLFEVAQRIRSMLRVEDTVARLGGDEFAILVRGAGQPNDIAKLASHLIDTVGQPFVFDQNQVQVGLSIGVAFAPRHGDDSETVFKRADLALYRAKAEGRDTCRFFEPAMDEAVEERRKLEHAFRLGLQRGEFEVHYQPFMEVQTGKVSGFEALVRWRHPTRSLIPPSAFIPLAEETGLIVPLGEWVLRTATADACRWPDDTRVAVNISAVQLRRASLMHTVISCLAETGLSPNRLELEVTESVLIGNSDSALEQLRGFSGMGIKIALDDFGTGYSSLSYLRRFQFNRIKIDRSFVAELADSETATIVRAMVALGNNLGMAVTAEGVETQEQMQVLRDQGCGEVQGFLIGRPVPEADLVLIAQARVRPMRRDLGALSLAGPLRRHID